MSAADIFTPSYFIDSSDLRVKAGSNMHILNGMTENRESELVCFNMLALGPCTFGADYLLLQCGGRICENDYELRTPGVECTCN